MSSPQPVPTTRPPYRRDLLGLSMHELVGLLHGEQGALLESSVTTVAALFVRSLNKGGVVYWCGNGGSAAQCDHLAAELMGRFSMDRAPLASVSLTNHCLLLALENDYGHEITFSRQVEALGKPGDVLVGMTTSGRSRNVIEALKVGKGIGMDVVAMVGGNAGDPDVLANLVGCSCIVAVPGVTDTAKVQEAHLEIGHNICRMVEGVLFGGRR